MHRYGGVPLLRADLAAVYDAFETPRAVRGELELLDAPARSSTSRRCASARSRLRRAHGVGDGVLHELVLRHEQQHTETMLPDAGARAAAGCRRPARRRRAPAPGAPRGLELVEVAGGDVRARRRAPTASPTTTSARATRSSSPPSAIAPHARSRTRRWLRLRRGRRLRAARVVVRRGAGRGRSSTTSAPSRVDGRRARVANRRCEPLDPAARRPRLLVRGRRLRPRARRAPPDRGGVGEGGDLGPAAHGRAATREARAVGAARANLDQRPSARPPAQPAAPRLRLRSA